MNPVLNFDIWKSNNSMIMLWITNSTEQSLQGAAAYTQTAAVMWEELKQQFSQGNAPRVRLIKADISNLKKGGCSVLSYFAELKRLCDELEGYLEPSVCTCRGCTSGAAKNAARNKEIEKLHIDSVWEVKDFSTLLNLTCY
ncbi:hypothetical protein CDL15_Pgr020133 [Punica granatum]|uniref:Uncharacterized protein n=1 Tax=Punica granatum TaxID=22663 RepID=A0A218VRA0_PUNGR|nr:hypothetical protein CDL15_Pgr020133 [Punica granatum]